jgi:hypothetical protein
MGVLSHRYLRIRSSCGVLLVSGLPCIVHRETAVSLETELTWELSSTIPEITDADMAFQAAETHADTEVGPFHKQYRLFHAAFAQFCYTGAQVRMNTSIQVRQC